MEAARGESVEGEMSFRLCEVANYLQASHTANMMDITQLKPTTADHNEHCLKEMSIVFFVL